MHITSCTHPIQKFPHELDSPTYPDPNSSTEPRGRSEVDRRRKYFERLQGHDQPVHDLLVMIRGCLENDATNRPTIEGVMETLKQIQEKHELTDESLPFDRLELLKKVS